MTAKQNIFHCTVLQISQFTLYKIEFIESCKISLRHLPTCYIHFLKCCNSAAYSPTGENDLALNT